ncbi:peptidylprolyl isomerase [Polluticaenibacter yanchengensis]|uniref:Periplasmic chaperone PpiD n=1 Tax=Polluticaenibacter yanchengensis TaxID=3014562 RepID=A0ABT4UQ04_9BACT|nr:SurA N-terminal domain-containing protein [Chitinophagaceae bacterium LY-5]
MSIIEQLREKYAAVGFGFIALSLIAFVLMDAGKGGGGEGVKSTDAVGEVNGTKVSYREFQDQVKMMEQNYTAQGRAVDDAAREGIYNQVWNSIVDKTLIDTELDKAGLTVTDKELTDMLFGDNPPQELRQAFTDPKTGVYDPNALRQRIAQLKKQSGSEREQTEQYFNSLKENKRIEKYFGLVTESYYVPKFLAEKVLADDNTIVSFRYVGLPFTQIADSSVKISDKEILDFANKNADEYKVKDASRNIAYVSYSINPSKEDSANVLNAVNGLKEGLIESTDAALYVMRNASTLPFQDAYYSKTRIQIPQKDSILGAVGRVYGPYLDGNNYVISKVVDVKTLPDSVKVRHILIQTKDRQNQPVKDPVLAKQLADSLLKVVNAPGANWTNLALQFSDDPGSKQSSGVIDFFPQGQMFPEFNDFSFNKPKGTKEVVETQMGYHVVEVLDQKNFEPAYKVAYLAKSIEVSTATLNDAVNKANVFYSKAGDLKKFNEAVVADGLTKLISDNISATSFVVPGIGADRKLVNDIFKADVGDVLAPQEVDGKYIVVAVTGEQKAGLPSADKLRAQIEPLLMNKAKANLLIAKLKDVKTLEEASEKFTSPIYNADSVSLNQPALTTGAFEPKVVAYASNKDAVNKLSPAIAGNSGVYLVFPSSIGTKANASTDVAAVKQRLTDQAVQTLQNQMSYGSPAVIKAIKKTVAIVDKRAKFM